MFFDIDAHRWCFATSPGEAYFWHGLTNGCGGQYVAMDIAKENNGKTLEMCMIEHRDQLEQAGVQFLNRPDGTVEIFYGTNQQECEDFWSNCSKAFADQASGDVHVIEGADLRPNGQSESEYPSVYNRIEHPALEQNQQVNSITQIDPYTRSQTGYESFDTHKSNDKSTTPFQAESAGGGGARAPDKNERGNTENEPNTLSSNNGERGTKPTQADNTNTSNKTEQQERGQKPAQEDAQVSSNQNVPRERGQKPAESERNVSSNNPEPRGEKPQEGSKNTSETISNNAPDNQFAKASGEATNQAPEQATQNIMTKTNGMGM